MNLLELNVPDKATTGYRVLTHGEALDNICFPISMKELSYSELGFNRKTGYKGLVRDDTGECLYAGKEYTPIHNREIIIAMEPLLNDGFLMKDVRVYNDRKFQINLWNPDVKFEINGQPSHLRATFGNSYDGSQSFSVALGSYIQVCGNGLVIGKGFAFKRKHTGLNDLTTFMSECLNQRQRVIDKLTGKDWQDFEKDKLVNLFDRITKNIPDGKDNKPNPVKVLLNEQFKKEMELYHNSEFALFMATTNIGTHGHKLGISPSYQMELDNQVSNVFFNN